MIDRTRVAMVGSRDFGMPHLVEAVVKKMKRATIVISGGTLTEAHRLIERLYQRLESHGDVCCRLDARDKEVMRDANKFLNRERVIPTKTPVRGRE